MLSNKSSNKLLLSNRDNNRLTLAPRDYAIFYASTSVILLSLIALSVNTFFYHYIGVDYSSTLIRYIGVFLFLVNTGVILLFGRTHKLSLKVREVCYYYMVTLLICAATFAVQFTPFSPIDNSILSIEAFLHIDLAPIVVFASQYPVLKNCLAHLYDFLYSELMWLPLIVIAAGRFADIREWYFLLLASTAIGFTIYYFFPTTAPASVIDIPYFYDSQRATGIKFSQIHNYLTPTTSAGGMISFPSFHVIWAWYCLYLIRHWRIAFYLLLPINLLIIASCVLLGWHYLIDLVGSLLVIVVAHRLYYISCAKERPMTRAQMSFVPNPQEP